MLDKDNVLIDSTDSILTEKIPTVAVYRFTCVKWRYNIPTEIKNAWSKRAKKLNNRKVPGKFVTIPWNKNHKKGNNNSVKEKVLESLSFEWDIIVSFSQNCITRQPRRSLSSMVYTFGKEKVPILSQTYREHMFSFLLEIVIFGKEFNNIEKTN